MTTSELMDFLLQRQHTVERSDSIEMRDSSRLGCSLLGTLSGLYNTLR